MKGRRNLNAHVWEPFLYVKMSKNCICLPLLINWSSNPSSQNWRQSKSSSTIQTMTGPPRSPVAVLLVLLAIVGIARCGDPELFFDWTVTYGTVSPLGIPQRVILINDQFPGPTLNTTTNNVLYVNVFNKLEEPLLFTWYACWSSTFLIFIKRPSHHAKTSKLQ